MRMDSKGPAANTFRMDKSLTFTLAQYAASTSIEKIPADVWELAKQVILDEMASAHLGRRSLGGGLAARYVATLGGPQEAHARAAHARIQPRRGHVPPGAPLRRRWQAGHG